MGRERAIAVALGAPGMGKSALTKKLVARYPGEVRVLDPSGSFDELGEWPGRRGVQDWIDELTAEGEGPAGGGWGPGLLVLDDCDRYLTAQAVDNFRDVWLANRHLGLDVIANAHRPQGVPKDMIASAHRLYLFAQEEPRALEYLMKIRQVALAVGGAYVELPTRPGKALLVQLRGDVGVSEVDVFED
jgi:hypothetical protein